MTIRATSDTRAEHESERGTAPAIDGERLYTLAYGAGDTTSLVTRDLADLSNRDAHQVGAPDETRSLHAADGRLILRTADGLVAYEDAGMTPTPPAGPGSHRSADTP